MRLGVVFSLCVCCLGSWQGAEIMDEFGVAPEYPDRYTSALTSSYLTTVISIQKTSDAAGGVKSPMVELTHSSIPLTIGGKSMTCSAKSDGEMDSKTRNSVREHRLRSQFSALQGYVVPLIVAPSSTNNRLNVDSVKFFPNDKIEISINPRTFHFHVAHASPADIQEDPDVGGLWYVPKNSPIHSPAQQSEYSGVLVSCVHREIEPHPQARICRPGNQVPGDPTRILFLCLPSTAIRMDPLLLSIG
jgi:hypothetical protein